MFVAPPGYVFWERDYSGIEAVLVGWLAKSERYMRLAKLDIHSFYTAHAIGDKGLLPDEGMSDSDLKLCLAECKRVYKKQRQPYKSVVHGSNYMEGPFMVQETLLKELHTIRPIKQIRRDQAVYFELFPEIKVWHERVTGALNNGQGVVGATEQENAHQRTWLRTPFGNQHHYYDVLAWDKYGGHWQAKYSSDAKRSIAFIPQSSARFVLTRAAQRLSQPVQDTLRLFVHDSLLGLCKTAALAQCLHESKVQMEQPVPELANLIIHTEAKTGLNWGEMETVAD